MKFNLIQKWVIDDVEPFIIFSSIVLNDFTLVNLGSYRSDYEKYFLFIIHPSFTQKIQLDYLVVNDS